MDRSSEEIRRDLEAVQARYQELTDQIKFHEKEIVRLREERSQYDSDAMRGKARPLKVELAQALRQEADDVGLPVVFEARAKFEQAAYVVEKVTKTHIHIRQRGTDRIQKYLLTGEAWQTRFGFSAKIDIKATFGVTKITHAKWAKILQEQGTLCQK